jgi:integrase
MATSTNRPDIGTYRKIRLRANAKGYWEVWWTDATGNSYLTRRESTKTKDRTEATAYLDQFCADARAQAVTGPAPAATVEELCRGWLDFVEIHGKAVVGGYALAAIRRELGHYPAGQLDGVVLQDYARARKRSQGTIRRELSALRTVLIWAADQRRISRDDVPIFKGVIPASGPPRTKFLDGPQEKQLWEAALRWGSPGYGHDRADRATAATRVMLFVALGLETAARRGAILDLTWDRVDLGRRTIDYQVPGQRLTKKRRVQGVPISDRLLPVLKEAWLRAPKDTGGKAQGRVIGTRYIAGPFARFTREVGMEWVTPHVLRHTWGSLKAMKGIPLSDIAKGMGDTVATIEATYLHVTPDHMRAVFNA